ncbi:MULTISPECIES: phosphotransferase [Rothia]|uniref:Aminoglycoside phosphotransferase n=1 Tax=Rothia nasimurium TaxID=85336 RepID=A0A1Y1RLD8_9MICC|nr:MULTISPECIES: phosphotransferase [Rothia]ORC15164.1 aminoglycoside phosphotransferase [Rothia nasimurium]
MTSTPLQLAAIVSAGVPGLYPVAALPSADDALDFDSAIIIDSANKRWRVRAPKHPEASVRLEAEHVILQSFTPGLRARLPFLVPTIVGTVPLDGRHAFIYSHNPGSHYDIDGLAGLCQNIQDGPGNIADDIAHTIATIHAFPTTIVESADLPVYTCQQIRERRLAELDLAVATGKVPSGLLTRWEQQLNNSALWSFNPRVVHGDFNEDNLVLDQKKIVEITGWSEVCVGDPATDFTWLFASEDPLFRERVFEAYRREMPQEPDRHLETRANLYAEFGLAQWLIRGVELEDRVMVSEAVSMLNHLEADLRAVDALDPPLPEEKPQPLD